MNANDKEYERLGQIDFSNGMRTHELPPHVQAVLKARNNPTAEPQEQQGVLIDAIDPDVWQLIGKHASNTKEMARMNEMLQLLLT